MAAASVDRKTFELRARIYFAASRRTLATHDLMREAISLFAAVKTPVEFVRATNVIDFPGISVFRDRAMVSLS